MDSLFELRAPRKYGAALPYAFSETIGFIDSLISWYNCFYRLNRKAF